MSQAFSVGQRVEVLEAQLLGPPVWRRGTVVSFTRGGKPRVQLDKAAYVLTVLKAHTIR